MNSEDSQALDHLTSPRLSGNRFQHQQHHSSQWSNLIGRNQQTDRLLELLVSYIHSDNRLSQHFSTLLSSAAFFAFKLGY